MFHKFVKRELYCICTAAVIFYRQNLTKHDRNETKEPEQYFVHVQNRSKQSIVHVQDRSKPEQSIIHVQDRSKPEQFIVHVQNRSKPEQSIVHVQSRSKPEQFIVHIQNRSKPEQSIAHVQNRSARWTARTPKAQRHASPVCWSACTTSRSVCTARPPAQPRCR